MKKSGFYTFVAIITFITGVFTVSLLIFERVQNKEEIAEIPKNIEPNIDTQIQLDITESEIWKGRSGNYFIRWTTKDIYISTPRREEKLLSFPVGKAFEREKQRFLKEKGFFDDVKDSVLYQLNEIEKIENPLEKQRRLDEVKKYQHKDALSFRIMSVVGNLLTLEVSESSWDTNSVYGTVHWITIDLSKKEKLDFSPIYQVEEWKTKKSDLREYFSEQQLLDAILDNTQIKESIKRRNVKRLPKSLRELFSIGINSKEYFDKDNKPMFPLVEPSTGCSLIFDEAALNNYAFERIENNQIIVKLELGQLTCSKTYEVITTEIKLFIPEKLKSALILAESGATGFLSKDAEKIANENRTEFELRFVPIILKKIKREN